MMAKVHALRELQSETQKAQGASGHRLGNRDEITMDKSGNRGVE